MTEELVGRYRVIRRLGAGGLGTVDLAHDTLLDRQVALKRITVGDASDDRRKRLLREGQVAARLDHPNIARILDCVELGEELVLVLEYVEGETLGARLRREKSLPVPVAKHIALALLDALAHAHGSSVVHRDVKPENVMLTRAPAGELPGVKLLDFGIAKRLDVLDRDKLTATGAAVGTLTYMAPEQACGLDVDARADLYGVGATMFAMLAGRPPVRVHSLSDLLRSLCDEDPPTLAGVAGVDEALDAVVRRALARDPKGRFASASQMRDVLAASHDRALVEPTVTSHEASTVEEPKPPVPAAKPSAPVAPAPAPAPVSHRSRSAALAAAGLCVVGLVVWNLRGGPGDAPSERSDAGPVALAIDAAPAIDASPATAGDAGDAGAQAAPGERDSGTALAPAREAAAPPVAGAAFRIEMKSTGIALEPASVRAFEVALGACLRRPELDAAANGFGRLVTRLSMNGVVEDARYLGFDAPGAAPGFEDRRHRTRFEDLGQCLRQASLGRRVARPSSEGDRELVITFAP